jgi:nucleoside-diphosphate-sugar epimerase
MNIDPSTTNPKGEAMTTLNILVTGGAGYLGSTLVPALLNRGHRVTVLDSFIFGQSPLLDCCASSDFSIMRGDSRDESILAKLLKKTDVVIPLAALVGAPLCKRDQVGTISTNRDAIASITKLASKEQRIIIPTTNSGYGIGEKGVFCTEEMPLRPISLYGKTKVEAEEIVLARGNGISLRLATVFGMSPRMRLDLLVNDFTYRAFHDRFIVVFEGHFTRNYIHVRDVARAFMHAIDNFDVMKNQPYNVGLSDANLTKLELCAKIRNHLPDFIVLESPVGEDPDKRDYLVSNEKIEKTGFKPCYSLDMGIMELIKGFAIITNSRYSNV